MALSPATKRARTATSDSCPTMARTPGVAVTSSIQELDTRGRGSSGGETERIRPLLGGCRGVDRFRKLSRIDEGTYGVVYRALDLETAEVVALKQFKHDISKAEEDFPVHFLREISILMKLDHANIVRCHEVVVGKTLYHIFLVLEYAQHDLRGLLSSRELSDAEVKSLVGQLLRAVAHMHERWVIHRDLKTSNLLLTDHGVLKVCDFGLARPFGEPARPYTRGAVTLWYRAPELLLGEHYSWPVDAWSTGCVFAELVLGKPLFAGKAELQQLGLIFRLTGTPTEETWPGYGQLLQGNRGNLADFKLCLSGWHTVFPSNGRLTQNGLAALKALLECCPARRASADEALEELYFIEDPPPRVPSLAPTQ